MSIRGTSLIDGKATGRVKCTFANWTGVAYKLPRTELDRCKERTDLSQSGVYILFGVSGDGGDDVAYVGQAGPRRAVKGFFADLAFLKNDWPR